MVDIQAADVEQHQHIAVYPQHAASTLLLHWMEHVVIDPKLHDFDPIWIYATQVDQRFLEFLGFRDDQWRAARAPRGDRLRSPLCQEACECPEIPHRLVPVPHVVLDQRTQAAAKLDVMSEVA